MPLSFWKFKRYFDDEGGVVAGFSVIDGLMVRKEVTNNWLQKRKKKNCIIQDNLIEWFCAYFLVYLM